VRGPVVAHPDAGSRPAGGRGPRSRGLPRVLPQCTGAWRASNEPGPGSSNLTASFRPASPSSCSGGGSGSSCRSPRKSLSESGKWRPFARPLVFAAASPCEEAPEAVTSSRGAAEWVGGVLRRHRLHRRHRAALGPLGMLLTLFECGRSPGHSRPYSRAPRKAVCRWRIPTLPLMRRWISASSLPGSGPHRRKPQRAARRPALCRQGRPIQCRRPSDRGRHPDRASTTPSRRATPGRVVGAP
jgi:hypothetical protein